MKHLARIVTALVMLMVSVSALAGEPTINVTTDKPDAMYQVNQRIVFNVSVMQDGKPIAGTTVGWLRTGDDGQKETGRLTTKIQPVGITTTLKKPGFIRLTITLLDDKGAPRKDGHGNTIVFEGGAGVSPEKLISLPEPADFDAFWREQKRLLATVPIKAQLTSVPYKNDKLAVYDIKVDCAGGRPVSGYLVVPKDAKPRSLPAIVSFHGYGVDGAYLTGRPNAISLDINAHGIENGKPGKYYQQLKDGELNGYGFDGNQTPQSSYFLGMYLRIIRALDYVKTLREWDGRTLVVIGGSQGGMQALAAAGLDPQVNLCLASMPWCCDLDGVTLGRQRGWRPDPAPGLRYFDPAYHAKRIKTAYVLVDAGLGDSVCPPSGVTAMFNNIPSSHKQLVYVQGATHGSSPAGSRTCWSLYDAAFQEITHHN